VEDGIGVDESPGIRCRLAWNGVNWLVCGRNGRSGGEIGGGIDEGFRNFFGIEKNELKKMMKMKKYEEFSNIAGNDL
jgi:hypothetical protein